MYKSLFISFTLLLLAIFTFPLFYSNYSQDAVSTDQKVVYDLPYPGILPDNPLYFVKAMRDRTQEIFTRDNNQKAQLYLLLSDKRVSMAQILLKKGKRQLAINTLSKGEKYALKIPDLLAATKKQGAKTPDDIFSKFKQSNDKHKEVIEAFMKEAPRGEIEALEIILQNNDKVRKALGSV